MSHDECVAERIDDGFDDNIRIVVGLVSEFKRTARAHAEPQSPLFDGRLAHIHDAITDMRRAIREGDTASTFGLAERDSLSLLAVTMTGPEG